MLADAAAASDDGMTVSPLRNLDRKGGARVIMRQQFRRALGVMIATGNATLKLARLHYVRKTEREAVEVCRAQHSENGWRKGQSRGNSWFSTNVADGYETYRQFVNGRGLGTL